MNVSSRDTRWHAYLINLDRSPQRLSVMHKRLEDAGVSWNRVAGVDGQLLSPKDLVGIDTLGFLLSHGRYIVPGDIGVFPAEGRCRKCRRQNRKTFAEAILKKLIREIADRSPWPEKRRAGQTR